VDLDIVFLGTSASGPTARRGPSSFLVRRGGERLLFDCGEGTQRQLLRSVVGLVDLSEIFVSHYDADHYLGLPGLLKTFELRAREAPLTIYGPAGLRELFDTLRRVFGKLSYRLDLVELEPGDTLERDGYALDTFRPRHRANSLGYALVEEPRPGQFDVAAADARGVPFGPARGTLQRGESVVLPDGTTVAPDDVLGPPRSGRTIVYPGDTAPSDSVLAAAAGADVLIHEATFGADDADRAAETQHSTAAQAAELAREADVGLLVLVHVSPRYFGPEIEREARAIFPRAVVAGDFDIVDVPLPERGEPQLHRRAARPPRGGNVAVGQGVEE
jgi:ribonuclease Z